MDDAGYLTSDALMFLAVYTAFRPRLRAVPVSRILDGLIVVAALALLWWWLLIHPVALTSELESLVTTAYPVFGLAVIGMLIATRLLPARNGTLAMRLVALGVTCSVLANALYVHVNPSSGYISGDWIELGWEAQGILFAVAAVVSAQGIGRPRNWMRFRENGELSVGLISGVVALSALVIARVWLALAPARGGLALRDGRTGAYSAEYAREQVRSFMLRARHFGEPFAVALAAVDNCHGRNDDLDTALAERLTAAAREVDVVASTGGGHFAVAMPNVEPDEAIAIAERLRHAVAAEARIVAVADALVSMTSDRPYRAARSETSALTTIWRDSAKRYDPAVVSALLALAREGRLPSRETEAPEAIPAAERAGTPAPSSKEGLAERRSPTRS